jgi:hypothetical protein
LPRSDTDGGFAARPRRHLPVAEQNMIALLSARVAVTTFPGLLAVLESANAISAPQHDAVLLAQQRPPQLQQQVDFCEGRARVSADPFWHRHTI